MNSKTNDDEKALLKQITFLTRLIKQKNSEFPTAYSTCSNGKSQVKSVANIRYRYHGSNKLVAINHNQTEGTSMISGPTNATLKRNPVSQTYCRLKTSYINNSCGSSFPNFKNNVDSDGKSQIFKKIDSEQTGNKQLDSVVASTNKKYIHVNRKRLLVNDPDLKSTEEQPSAKRNVHVNPRNKINVHINSAKLLISSMGEKDGKNVSCKNNTLPSTKQSIHINPNMRRIHTKLINKLSEPPGGRETGSQYKISPVGQNTVETFSSCEPVDQKPNNAIKNIHVNKNFIDKSSSVNGLRKQTTAPNVSNYILKNKILGNDSTGDKIVESNTKIKTLAFSSSNAELLTDQQHGVNKVSPSALNKSLSPINSDMKLILKNKLIQSALKGKEKLAKLNRAKLTRLKNEFALNASMDSSSKCLYSLLKLRKTNKNISCKKSLNSKYVSDTSLNIPSCMNTSPSTSSKKQVLNSVMSNSNKFVKVSPRNSKQVFRNQLLNAVKSDSPIRSTELIKLTNTKLIRKRSRLSTGTDKINSHGKRKSIEDGLPLKRNVNKNVWISSKANSKLVSQDLVRNSSVINSSLYKIPSNFSNNRYKYNSKNSAASKVLNKSSLVKVNSLISPVKKSTTTTLKILCRSPANQSLTSLKGKYGVQKHRVSLKKSSPNSSCLVSVSPTKLIRSKTDRDFVMTKTNYKLVRSVKHSNRSLKRSNSVQSAITGNKLIVTNKLSSTTRTAKSVKTKYKLIRNANVVRTKMNWNNASIAASSDSRSCRLYHMKNKIDKRIPVSRNHRLRKKSVTIGGINYHTTGTKLRRKYSDKVKVEDCKIFKNKGDSYRVSCGGRSLKRINPISISAYRQKSLIRAGNSSYLSIRNTHFARNKVLQAKQRSIALLTKKLRKNNEPCLIFHRFGKCSGKERGTCSKLHDKKNVTICKKFLKGVCENVSCLLSHDVGPSKMPTCRHYLAGICFRDDCPYLHVKLNSSAPICIAFLQGYCPNAEKCKKRHIDICPEYEEGFCTKGKSCLYPHPKRITSKEKSVLHVVSCTDSNAQSDTVCDNKLMTAGGKLEAEVSRLEIDPVPSRYYNVLGKSEESGENLIKEHENCDDIEDGANSVWHSKRPRLGLLPAFIPFDTA